MASDVPGALVRAAERLFAERGSESVSLRDITAASGAANASAVQYHFGGRAELIRALLSKHDHVVQARRHEMLDAYEFSAESDVRRLAEALVLPLAAELKNEDGGSGYLQLLADLYNRPNPRFDLSRSGAQADSLLRWRGFLTPLLSPEALRLHRRFDALRFAVSELARRGRSGRSDHRLFISQLNDLVTALLLAPVSEETRDLLRR